MTAPYVRAGLTLAVGASDRDLVRALQHDLRALGYLRSGIDGIYGTGTARAVSALQYDLLFNDGRGTDGPAPVAVTDFNKRPGGGSYVPAVTGICDQGFAAALCGLKEAESVGKIPKSPNPQDDNARAFRAIAALRSTIAPTPFILAMFRQESGGRHFNVPPEGDEDTYVTVGLDRNDEGNPDRITSRGYGVGQYTLFHQPPSVAEIADFVSDPVANVARAYQELREKFDHFVVGKHGADDRAAEHPALSLRLCRYARSDARYMNDCRNCAAAARKIDIERGTPAYSGASISYQPTHYYPSAHYPATPDRADFLCDWPYAARRYNGSGVNSFHYQARILRNLLL